MNSDKKTARSEENKSIVRSLIEAENKHNPALLDEFLAPDFATSDLTDTPEETQGREVLKQSYAQMYKGFPDWHGTIEDIIAEGDKVWVRYKGTGTHRGEYLGLAPTGKKVTMNSFTIYRIVDNKVVEWRSVIDLLDFYEKLGVIEYKGFPDEVT
jgi:steroid delta-isomerase-like uncharacterized protein